MGKKKFIDKKKSATFQLLARDSSTPNHDETPGSDRVFVRIDNNPFSLNTFADYDSYDHDDPNSIFADAPEDVVDGGEASSGYLAKYGGGFDGFYSSEAGPLPEQVRKEILELGFPDDGYNYLTHLREIKKTGGGSAFFPNPKFRLDELPRDVKAYDASRVNLTEVKTEDGHDNSLYRVASKTVGVRVQKAFDPEVAALLDDSDLSRFGSDVEDLEEDFVVRANISGGGVMENVDTDQKFQFFHDSEVIDGEINNFITSDLRDHSVAKVGNTLMGGGHGSSHDEPRARRPLDEQFDLMELQEYGADDEDDETSGFMVEEDESLAEKLQYVLKGRAMDDELDGKYLVPAELLHRKEGLKDEELLDSAADVIRYCKEYVHKYENEGEEKVEDVIIEEESSDESEKWDCETIITTYSNLDNHPGKIGAPEAARKKKLAQTISGALNSSSHVISLRGKEKLPVDFLPHRKNASDKVKDVSVTKIEQHKRKTHGQESKEEKKERKAAVKEERREARRLKKEMKGLYQSESQRAQKAVAVAGPSSIHLM